MRNQLCIYSFGLVNKQIEGFQVDKESYVMLKERRSKTEIFKLNKYAAMLLSILKYFRRILVYMQRAYLSINMRSSSCSASNIQRNCFCCSTGSEAAFRNAQRQPRKLEAQKPVELVEAALGIAGRQLPAACHILFMDTYISIQLCMYV